MKNRVEVTECGVKVYVDTKIFDTPIEFIVDSKGFEKMVNAGYSWYVQAGSRNSYYIKSNVWDKELKKQKKVFLHRFITDAPDGLVVDHINNDTMDNRSENLRVVTHALNCQNRKGATKESVSGVRGVTQYKPNGTWKARFTLNGVRHHVGYFKTKEEAEIAVVKARSVHMTHSK